MRQTIACSYTSLPLIYTIILCGFFCFSHASEWIEYPTSGVATMTHYTLPLDFIASCGCSATSTHYPTAALNQMAYGSSTAFGPGCGRCFNLTLLNTFLSDPPFFPNVTKSVVVKVTDLCPLGGQWCSATPEKGNRYVLDIIKDGIYQLISRYTHFCTALDHFSILI